MAYSRLAHYRAISSRLTALFFWRAVAIGAFFLLLSALRTHAAENPARTTPASIEDRVLVRLKEGKDLNQFHRRLGSKGRKLLRTSKGARRPDLELVEAPHGERARVIAALQESGLVEYAEPDHVIRLQSTQPNDPRFFDQWHLKNTGIYGGTSGADIDAPSAWDIRTSAPNVVVAVIDTGVRATHEDLKDNLWKNPGETGTDAQGRNKATNGVDDDGNGYIDDVYGINALTGSGNPDDDYGHGTHVAAIIGGRGNNGKGVSGVAWQIKLMALKSIDASGNGTISDAIECIDYARAKGARIINASWGWYDFNSQALRDAMNGVRNDGIIFVAACGNSSGDNDATPLYPASYTYDNIVAVAATTRTDTLASFSNWGRTTVDLAAPGSPIFSAYGGSDTEYRYLDGTSQAAPQVAGAAALVWAQAPTLTYRQVIQYILNNTDPLPALTNKTVTGGRLNLAQTLAAVVLDQPETVPPAVAMLRPKLSSTVFGVTEVSATATDNVGVAGVQFTINGQPLGAEITAAPYKFNWNTATAANGVYMIGATARDAAGNKTKALAGPVTVRN